ESRESLRATVFGCVTPFVAARWISGCASRNADVAASLLPPAIAASTFLRKVRMRDLRDALRAVRVLVCRMRLRAEAVLAMCPVVLPMHKNRKLPAAVRSGRAEFYAAPAFESRNAGSGDQAWRGMLIKWPNGPIHLEIRDFLVVPA